MRTVGILPARSNTRPLVIVGASHAGVQVAASARALGFEGRIVMLSDESHVPYQRPPLSKGVLSGKTTVAQLPLRGPGFFDEERIELMLGRRALSLEVAEHTLEVEQGQTMAYGSLVIATGARCRTWNVPGASLSGVYCLRTLTDAAALCAGIENVEHACIVGGGFIGLEVASALRQRGIRVTVVVAQTRLFSRRFPERVASFVEQAHRRQGIEFRLGCDVRSAYGSHGAVEGVELESGERIACQAVVLGIGVVPNDAIARNAGIRVGNGIHVDPLARTSAPDVFAVGDVANMETDDPFISAGRLRLESIEAAQEGARAAASEIAGKPRRRSGVPWFWSDQAGLKLQMAGLPGTGDQEILRGEMSSGNFTMFYLRGGELVGAHSVNQPAEHMLSRRLIASRLRLRPEQWADESFDLRTLYKAAPELENT